jgi:DNA-binding transcriptional ArsR family regulator
VATNTQPALIDDRLLKALSNPTRQQILDLLVEGPSSPVRMQRRMDNVSLNLVSHHIKVLKELGCIELVETKKKRGATEHIYRVIRPNMFSAEEWLRVEPSKRPPLTTNILRMISEDSTRALVENRFDEKDSMRRVGRKLSGASRGPLTRSSRRTRGVPNVLSRAARG